jgi:hypothetical protein
MNESADSQKIVTTAVHGRGKVEGQTTRSNPLTGVPSLGWVFQERLVVDGRVVAGFVDQIDGQLFLWVLSLNRVPSNAHRGLPMGDCGWEVCNSCGRCSDGVD